MLCYVSCVEAFTPAGSESCIETGKPSATTHKISSPLPWEKSVKVQGDSP
jgi:hypothetical protein